MEEWAWFTTSGELRLALHIELAYRNCVVHLSSTISAMRL